MLISGEPGIGKSRLTAALAERIGSRAAYPPALFLLAAPPGQRALSRSSRRWNAPPGLRATTRPKPSSTNCEALLAPAAPTDDDVALLAEMLSLPSGDRHPRSTSARSARRSGHSRRCCGSSKALARQRPVLMVFEDAHWIDPTSRELLDLTVDRMRRLPVLLVVTFRPEFQPPWVGQPHVTSSDAQPARRTRRRRRWCNSSPAMPRSPPRSSTEIVERTDGVPLFVEELTKAVLEGRRATGCRGAGRRVARRAVGAGDLACLADGAARPARAGGQGGRADRRGDRPRVCL